MAPLRDRPLSNSPDTEWPPRATTPLRIAKRDTPQRPHASQISRRNSNTYSRLTNSSLVSQSPFRSQIPAPPRPSAVSNAPTPRKSSGEKRPRPSSMHAQAENEKPLGFKRRQSKGFQGLIEREPVKKSPFRNPTSQLEDPFPPPPTPTVAQKSHLPTPTSSSSPTRSSLVSKRLHGPRTQGHDQPVRQRRKTVTFDERCDVVTFERDEVDYDEDPFSSDDEYDFGGRGDEEHEDGGEGDDSITGLVDSMLEDTRDGSLEVQTPPHDGGFPEDLDAEDDVPYGRSHHADRAAVAHHHDEHDEAGQLSPPNLSPDASDSPPISTPPRNRDSLAEITSTSPGSHIPLGRSTHSERIHAERTPDDLERDVQMLPPSPSPAKGRPSVGGNKDALVPRFGIDVHRDEHQVQADRDSADPFAMEQHDVQVADFSFMSDEGKEEGEGEGDVSFSGLAAELGLSSLGMERKIDVKPAPSTPPLNLRSSLNSVRSGGSSGGRELPAVPRSRSASPFTLPVTARISSPAHGRSGSPSSLAGSPAFNPRMSSPLGNPGRVTSPPTSNPGSIGSHGSMGSLNGRPRISREDVHRRLLRKRSVESPLNEIPPSGDALGDEKEPPRTPPDAMDLDDLPPAGARFGTPLRRGENPTYDGVMSIDPEPQPTDPPRPSAITRAYSADDAASETFKGINLDFSDSGTGMDLGLKGMDFAATRVEIGDVKSALDQLVQDVQEGSTHPPANGCQLKLKGSQGSLRVEAVTEGVKARQFPAPRDLDTTMEEDETMEDEGADASGPMHTPASPKTYSSAGHTPELLAGGGFTSPPLSRSASGASLPPPPPPPKDAIKTREQMILEKRREQRRREDDENMGRRTPPRNERAALGVGRPGKRRSLSTGDAEDLEATRRKGEGGYLDVSPFEQDDDPLGDVIQKELSKLDEPAKVKKSKYHVRERTETIYASSDADKVSHMSGAGDLNTGRAWRTVRRPSDMNEYAKQIREFRAQEKPGKAHGKVFVRVVDVKGLRLPLPQQPTALTCTLNNGIHFVTTPECRLGPETSIEQEFELIEHSKLEFTLTLKIRRDPHIVAQFKANSAPPPPPQQEPPPPPPASKGGMRSFFSSPKKQPKVVPRPIAPPPAPKLQENLARYLKPDGTLARVFVSFKDIASRCDGRLFETNFPLIGQRLEDGARASPLQVGELVLQFFRLPAMPGIPSNQLPQSLEECHKGLRRVQWHKTTYHDGTLTQCGGDCPTWRRRHFRVTGGRLLAFNDVTRRVTTAIDLRQATGVEEIRDPRSRAMSPASVQTTRSTAQFEEFDEMYGVQRAFRMFFQRDEPVVFFADTDEEKDRWLEVFRALIGMIPPHPLWAELLWQRQEDLAKANPPPSHTPAAGSSRP